MKGHRHVLANALKKSGNTQKSIATALGYSSPSAVGMMLAGQRGIGRAELEQMCALAGMTITELVAASDDMPGYFRSKEAAEAAAMLDRLSNNQLEVIVAMLKVMKTD